MSEWQELGGSADLMDEVSLLALFLCNHAGGEKVRTLEAIACAYLNRKNRGNGSLDAMSDIPVMSPVDPLSAGDTEKAMSIARRVARRALNGGLADSTSGATMFHHIDLDPEWARQAELVHSEGDFLFFRLKADDQKTSTAI